VPPLPKSQEIKLVMHYPKTAEGTRQLSQQVAEAHASAVIHKINGTRSSVKEKIAMMQAVANAAKKRQISKEQNEIGL
jgi:hypothetical protein